MGSQKVKEKGQILTTSPSQFCGLLAVAHPDRKPSPPLDRNLSEEDSGGETEVNDRSRCERKAVHFQRLRK